ncbi:MAG TPA: hypothetical protein VFO46_02375 [Candidatus Sulfotelmatobacter sp.]|nr:hypothetical protein [Candidatus Sulfotelmatobacter sp.]
MTISLETELTARLASGATLPFLIQWLKSKSWFPLVNYNTERLNQVSCAGFALAASTTILFTFSGGVLTVSGLTPASIGHFFYSWWSMWALNHLIYKCAVSPPVPGAIQDLARRRDDCPFCSSPFPERPE